MFYVKRLFFSRRGSDFIGQEAYTKLFLCKKKNHSFGGNIIPSCFPYVYKEQTIFWAVWHTYFTNKHLRTFVTR